MYGCCTKSIHWFYFLFFFFFFVLSLFLSFFLSVKRKKNIKQQQQYLLLRNQTTWLIERKKERARRIHTWRHESFAIFNSTELYEYINWKGFLFLDYLQKKPIWLRSCRKEQAKTSRQRLFYNHQHARGNEPNPLLIRHHFEN